MNLNLRFCQVKKDQLTRELQMIDNTIVDREMEISINHASTEEDSMVDHGSYVDHGMMQV